ncbi:MAG: SUMF1/EgtB/PvdO family nonheme iron enzyme [Pseudomonadota bacterium]
MSGERHALLIGCGTFDDPNISPLRGALGDVDALKTVLEERGGFASVETLPDPTLAQFRRAVAALYHGRRRDDFVLFYFAGHGRLDALSDDFHFVAKDTELLHLTATAVDLPFLHRTMGRSGARRQAVILDCCHAAAALPDARRVPPERVHDEATFAIEGYGTEFLAATDKLKLAHEEDGVGLFTQALVEGLGGAAGAPDALEVSLRDLDGFVRRRLRDSIADPAKDMRPVYACHAETSFPLVRKAPTALPLPDDLIAAISHETHFARLGAADAVLRHVEREPLCREAATELLRARLLPGCERDYEVRQKLEETLGALVSASAVAVSVVAVSREPAQPPSEPDPPARHVRKPLTVFRDVDAPWCPEMVVIPAGEFLMGSPPDEKERYGDEGPQHRVSVPSFALGRFPVTFDEYDHFCEIMGREKPEDAGWGRGRRPVINVSWQDADAYLSWLSEVSGQAYRLPSEAEWEYACRAGTTTRFSFGDDADPKSLNYGGNVGETTEVGSYSANAWSLHDMHGNVWEWCADGWHDGYEGAPTDGSAQLNVKGASRVVRGGSWLLEARGCRAACRLRFGPGDRLGDLGFRPARGQG